jgi:hypothetical protein
MLNSNTKNIILEKFKDIKENKFNLTNYTVSTVDLSIDNNNNNNDDNDINIIEIDNNLVKNITKLGILDRLNKSDNIPLSSRDIKLCLYKIVKNNKFSSDIFVNFNKGSSPFIEFCLYKDTNNNTVRFPTLPYSKDIIKKSLQSFQNVWKEFYYEIVYEGYYQYNNEIYLWFKVNNNEEELTFNSIKGNWFWCLVSEIINYKSTLEHLKIDESITKMFLKNTDMFYLRDELNNIYEIPEVKYYGGNWNDIQSVAILGAHRQSPLASLGPYYYFGNYKSGIRYAIFSSTRKPVEIDGDILTIDENGRWKEGGLVRFAVFTGKHNMKIRTKTFSDLLENNYNLPLTNKLVDGGFEWINDFDSIGLGTYIYKTEEGTTREIHPLLAVKSFVQQVPLTYYRVNTNQDIENDVYIL